MEANDILLILIVYGGVILAVLWLALVIWAYRDMRLRSRDLFAQLLVAIVVAVLNIPGVFIYILLRPRETLSEAYERSLEEEALLQEIEEKPTCPGCSQRVKENWQACPSCHTRLKKPCIACGQMLELAWNLCPYCATSQVSDYALQSSRHVRPASPASPLDIPDKWLSNPPRDTTARRTTRPNESIEFVDGDDF